MSLNAPIKPDADLDQRRIDIFRGLTVINSLNLGVVVLVAALAIIAILLGLKARDDAAKLWNASVTQAQASRFGGEIGWKSNALRTITRASEVRPSLGLRNEAIAALSTLDLDLAGPWHNKGTQWGKTTFSPDLHRVALGNVDGVIEVLDATSGSQIRKFKMGAGIANLIFDGTGRYVGARDNRGRLSAWNVETGAEVISVAPEANTTSYDTMVFVGNWIVTSLPRGRLLYLSIVGENQKIVDVGQDYQLMSVDSTGRVLIGSWDKLVEMRDGETGALLKKITSPGSISSIAVSPGGKFVAAGSSDMSVYLWRTAEDEMQTLSGHQGLVFRVTFDPTGSRLASCAFGGTTKIWETESGFLLLGTQSLFVERFGADGVSLACSRIETGFGVGRLLDTSFTRSFHVGNQADNSTFIKLLTEDWAAVAMNSGPGIMDLVNGTMVAKAMGQRIRGTAFDEKKQIFYTTGNDGLQLRPVVKTTNDYAFGPARTIPVEKGKASEQIHLNAERTEALVRIGFEGAELIDLATEKMIAYFPTPNVGAMAMSPDGKTIVTGTFHGDGARIWKRTGELIKHLGGRDAWVQFSPDGKWFTTVASDLCVIYETDGWREHKRFPMNSASGLPGLAAFSPDSRIFAFTVMRRMVRLIDPESGTELATLTPEPAQLLDDISFSPTGKRLAVATHAGAMRVWELDAMQKNLAALKLDWNPGTPAGAPVSIEQNIFKWVALASALTLLAALGCSLVSWVRHRHFVTAYQRIEKMIEQRNQQLAAAQSELFQSQKMQALGTLAAGIAHDFNNLLSVIRLSNQLTTEATTENAEAQENARIIDRAVAQGKSVVRSMLGYSRNSGARENFSVPQVIEETLGLLRQQFLARVEVSVNTSGNVSEVFGSKNRVEQVLLNLIVNAVEAMKGAGRLRISTRRVSSAGLELTLKPAEAADYVEVTIGDTGPGMEPEVLRRMFEPFFTTKTVGNEPGTGLGLSLVYGVCKEEGIGIAVKSAVGAGTEFRLLIPARGGKEMPAAADSASVAG